jgi:hypothetical protein
MTDLLLEVNIVLKWISGCRGLASDQFGYITVQSLAHVITVRLRGSRITLPASAMSPSKRLWSVELQVVL